MHTTKSFKEFFFISYFHKIKTIQKHVLACILALYNQFIKVTRT
jgi:hypothetical protein